MDSKSLKLSDLVERAALDFPEKEALINEDGTKRFTYNKFNELVNNLAKGLISIGVQKGDRVIIWSKNAPEWIISQFAISKSGAIMVPFNSHEKAPMISRLLKNSDATTLIMMEGAQDKENIEMLYEICPEFYKSEAGRLKLQDYPSLRNIIVISENSHPGTFSWKNMIQIGEESRDDELVNINNSMTTDDYTHMIYTSGTTGNPKGVLLTHRNLILDVEGLSGRMNIKPEDKMCIQPPLFHTFGCSACAILAVYNGCGMVIMDKYRPKATLKQIEKEKCTIASGVPTMFVGFLKEYQSHKYDISSLRTGIIAGSAAPKGLIKDVIEKMGIEGLISSYGMTEASPAVTATNYDDSTYYKSESTGYPLPGVEIKIVDEHTGETKPRGKEGEIHVRGATVTKGYYKMPDETARAIDADGWLHTGDVGFIRDNGYLTITCRIKDIIIRSGENINPAEIEDFISSHEEVEEIYAVGVPDDVYGEEVMAFIKLREGSVMTESEIRNFCKGKIATNKIPKYIIFVDQYPVTDTGKVSKAKLKELALKML